MNAELNRTLEFPPRLPVTKRHGDGSSLKRKHDGHSSSPHKSSKTSTSSHAHCCCHTIDSYHSGDADIHHSVQAPTKHTSSTRRIHKHRRTITHTCPSIHHEKQTLGKYTSLFLLFHISKNFLDPRLIPCYSTRYSPPPPDPKNINHH